MNRDYFKLINIWDKMSLLFLVQIFPAKQNDISTVESF